MKNNETKLKVLMISESTFPADPRVRQEAYKLVDNGFKVGVIALKSNNQPRYEKIDKLEIFRVPDVHLFNKNIESKKQKYKFIFKLKYIIKSIVGYGFEYFYFTLLSFLYSLWLIPSRNFKVIHVHNPPDTLFLIGLFWKIFGKKFVFDHHDLSPDLYLEKYDTSFQFIYKILLFLEKCSCKLADLVIATNESYKKIEKDRCHIREDKIVIVRNGPDLDRIKKVEPKINLIKKGITNLCYLGAINKQDGVDNIIKILHLIVDKYNFSNIHLILIGDGDYLKEIKILANKLKVDSYVTFTGLVLDKDDLNSYLSSADIFIDAALKSFLNDNSTFIKHMEYMVFNKPIVSFNLKESMYSLGNTGIFIESNDFDGMAKNIINLTSDDNLKNKLGKETSLRLAELNWEVVSVPLVESYNKLHLNC